MDLSTLFKDVAGEYVHVCMHPAHMRHLVDRAMRIAMSDAVLGYFDWQQKDYKRIPIDEQVEVLNLTGNIALADGEPKLHPHIVLGKADGTACGGHLLEAHVRPTLELIVTESPAHLQRRSDPETGLALIRL